MLKSHKFRLWAVSDMRRQENQMARCSSWSPSTCTSSLSKLKHRRYSRKTRAMPLAPTSSQEEEFPLTMHSNQLRMEISSSQLPCLTKSSTVKILMAGLNHHQTADSQISSFLPRGAALLLTMRTSSQFILRLMLIIQLIRTTPITR